MSEILKNLIKKGCNPMLNVDVLADKRKVKYCSCNPDDVELVFESMDEAIESHLDSLDVLVEEIVDELRVYGYAPKVINPEDLKGIAIESIISYFYDGDYESPYGDSDVEITQGMENVEKEFIKKMVAEYKPWACDLIATETINPQNWIKEHRPDWYKNKPI
jgi:hypothetical protein